VVTRMTGGEVHEGGIREARDGGSRKRDSREGVRDEKRVRETKEWRK
jgi:hypothetical protein